MEEQNKELRAAFPELEHPEETISRLSEAFVAPEYATAAMGFMRQLVEHFGETTRMGLSTVITAPHEYDNLILTISKWWFFNFHIAEAESLEEGDDVEEMVPLDYENIMEHDHDDEEDHEDHDDEVDLEEDELTEATFYQVGTFLLDSTIIPHETIFDREDLDCYAYDYPEERVSAERFYWARFVWEPEDFQIEDLRTAIFSAAEFLLDTHGDEVPFAEFHNKDFATLVANKELCDRAIAAADFGDVIVIEGSQE